jgi:electron transfer flavoprotein alpha subunit
VSLTWENDELVVRRPVFGGRVYEEVAIVSRPAVITVRPGSSSGAEQLPSPGRVETTDIDVPESLGLEVVGEKSTRSGIRDLTEARRVVAGGRGMGEANNFQLVEELADVLDSAVGASRSVVDAGMRPHDEQVGKSGKTISPELYVACGISGAIHHVLGMNASGVVVAINNDPDAPIFRHADFGLVGDALQVLPALTKELKRALGKE